MLVANQASNSEVLKQLNPMGVPPTKRISHPPMVLNFKTCVKKLTKITIFFSIFKNSQQGNLPTKDYSVHVVPSTFTAYAHMHVNHLF